MVVRHRRVIIGLIVLAAIGIRAACLFQLNASPLLEMQHWDQTDMNYYDAWARTVAGGDWLSATVTPPMHQWQRDVATAYLQTHQADAGQLAREAQAAGTSDLALVLWKRWMHTPQFYQDPLYIYFIAAIYRLAAPDARAVIAVQLLLGVCTIVLMWSVTRRYLGDTAAVCAAVLALLCAPLVFYETLLLRDSLVALAGLGIVWLAGPVLADARGDGRLPIGRAVALGLCGGLAWLLKSTFVALWFVIALGIVLGYTDRVRRLSKVAAAMLAGFAIAIAPLAVRNTAVGVAPLTLARLGGFTFVASNGASANPDGGWEIDAPGLASFLGDTDGSLRAAVRTTLDAHTPQTFVSLLWRKWDRTWHWFDIPNNENRYYAERQLPVLRWLPVTFWIVSPLALVGLVLGAGRVRHAWPLFVLVAFSAASVTLFVVIARQRIPLLAAAIPFAALTVSEVVAFAAGRRVVRAVVVVGSVVLLGAWTGRPRGPEQFATRTADWLLPFSIEGEHAAAAAIAAQDWGRAAAAYQDYFRRDEPSRAEAAAAEDPTLPSTLAKMHAICADLLARAGEDPSVQIGQSSDLLRIAEGRLATAGSLQQTVRDDMDQTSSATVNARRGFAATVTRRAVAEANAGRLTQAVADFRRVVGVDPHSSHAHFNLARALAASGDLRAALEEARQAAELAPEDQVPAAFAAQLEHAVAGR
jgi:tetratricopeptide (TPR) repeat protein